MPWRIMSMSTSFLRLSTLAAAASFYAVAPAAFSADYETAPYEVIRTDGEYEVRDYPALTVVKTESSGKNRDGAFMKLFRFIDGGNAASQKIAMTTPVFMEGKDMLFVMPKAASAATPAPKGTDVRVATKPAARYAVFRYAGWSSAKNEAAALERIQAWVKASGLKTAGEPEHAYYNPPWTPGPMRRNEVLVPVAK